MVQYIQEKEENLAYAVERVEEAVGSLEELLPDTAEELSWILSGMRAELLSVRSAAASFADRGMIS
ncbi:MAG: hypothetical protein IKC69_05945 [Clostridia bacterium]|nr:hypothetical protein [Clostridia bacterium]